MKKRTFILFFAVVGLVYSCKKDSTDEGNSPAELNIPKGFPYPNIPADNVPTPNRINLGKLLFFDPVLSKDSTIACASCHKPANYFSDTRAFSLGVGGKLGTRNAPMLYNIAYDPALFWDGGVPSLEEQVVGPIQNPLEMNMNINEVVKRLLRHQDYVDLFQEAYNQPPDVYALSRALASYERTLYSGNSRYDRYLQDGDSAALSASEIRGKNIFFGEKGECFHCHGEYKFSNFSYQNNGLSVVYADSGRARITLNHADYGKFKVPSLRNIAETAPYMHDGSIQTLEEVVEHYNSGGHPDDATSFFIKPLGLTNQDKADLVNFLKALTDSTVLIN